MCSILRGRHEKSPVESIGLEESNGGVLLERKTILCFHKLFSLSRAQNSSIKQESALVGLGPFEHKKGALHNKLDFTHQIVSSMTFS